MNKKIIAAVIVSILLVTVLLGFTALGNATPIYISYKQYRVYAEPSQYATVTGNYNSDLEIMLNVTVTTGFTLNSVKLNAEDFHLYQPKLDTS